MGHEWPEKFKILYSLQGLIKHWVEDVLTCVDQKNQRRRKGMNFDTPTKSHKEGAMWHLDPFLGKRLKYAHAAIGPASQEVFSMWLAYIHC
jgi:hypothetical protein